MTSDLRARRLMPLALLAAAAAAAPASAQSFVNASNQIPQGSPFNNSNSEGVDFADVDFDGDYDCVFADGGDCCNDQNRIWINLGGAQGGTIGFFQDETATRFPAITDTSRDLDFVDVDADGDQDLYISNTSQISNQSNRFWVNMGGAQGGTAGFFQDQTAAHWLNLGQNNGTTTFSSISPSLVLGSGGFIDWSCDCVFGDLDNDGAIDLVHTSYGGTFAGNVPSRLFLNNGGGQYEEFNPSGVQLSGSTIANGTPGLWCQGVHVQATTNATGAECDIADTPLGAEIGDMDKDFDIDILHGARNEIPRVFQGRLQENGGTLGFRDVTWTALTNKATGGGNYEQELGDFDNDGDLDIYGLNWSGFDDIVCTNDGTGKFGPFTVLSGSGSDDNEGEFLDYDNDGDLDIFVANFSGQDRLYRNSGAPAWSFTNVTSSELPPDGSTSLQLDSCDIDNDGDYDVMVANDAGQANVLLKNVSQIADARAPYLPNLEQAPDRTPSAVPTAVRVQVYDNAAWNVTQFNTAWLEYRVNGGAVQTVPMVYAGGNLFRGEIPGNLNGLISYQAKSGDRYGNVGASVVRSYNSGAGGLGTFCTSKPSSIPGCVPTLTGPSALVSKSAGAGSYNIGAAPVPGGGGLPGILIYTKNGLLASPANTPFGSLCLNSFLRLGNFPAVPGGNAGVCNGAYNWDFGNIAAVTGQIAIGDTLHIQAWYRDPTNPGTANFTQGIGPIFVQP